MILETAMPVSPLSTLFRTQVTVEHTTFLPLTKEENHQSETKKIRERSRAPLARNLPVISESIVFYSEFYNPVSHSAAPLSFPATEMFSFSFPSDFFNIAVL